MKTKQTNPQVLIARSIAKANRQYKNATAAQRRVLIAKDALEQLESRKLSAMCGNYIDATALAPQANEGEYVDVPLQPLLHDPKAPQCQACACGSLLLSAIRFRNRCDIDEAGRLSIDDSTRSSHNSNKKLSR